MDQKNLANCILEKIQKINLEFQRWLLIDIVCNTKLIKKNVFSKILIVNNWYKIHDELKQIINYIININ